MLAQGGIKSNGLEGALCKFVPEIGCACIILYCVAQLCTRCAVHTSNIFPPLAERSWRPSVPCGCRSARAGDDSDFRDLEQARKSTSMRREEAVTSAFPATSEQKSLEHTPRGGISFEVA